MQLMRIGSVGAERPAVRVDEDRYVDVSDAVHDFDEAFFGGDGLARLAAIVPDLAPLPASNTGPRSLFR